MRKWYIQQKRLNQAHPLDPGTNAPTETPNPEPAKGEHTCPPPPPPQQKNKPSYSKHSCSQQNRPWYKCTHWNSQPWASQKRTYWSTPAPPQNEKKSTLIFQAQLQPKKSTRVQMHPLKLPTLSQPKANILDHTRILYTRYYMIYYIQYTINTYIIIYIYIAYTIYYRI